MSICGSCGAEIELAWAAGFIDGEGSFSIFRNRHRSRELPQETPYYHRPVIRASQIIREPLDRLATRLDGYVSSVGPKGFAWLAEGPVLVARTARLLLPYLTVKRAQAELAIAYCEGAGRWHKRTERITAEEWAERDAMSEQMRALNGYRGVDRNGAVS